MKKLLKYLAFGLLMMTLTAGSCTDYESQIQALGRQLEELEKARTASEKGAEELSALIAAVQAEDELVGFSPVAEDGTVKGFRVTFKDAGEVVVYNRETNVSVGEDGGRYYWMADGEWLTDNAGNRIEINPEAPLPQFRASDGKLEVSVDGGNSFKPLGKVDKCLISNVTEDAVKIVFTLSGGTQIIIPKQQALKLTIEGDQKTIGAGESITATYRIEGADNATLTALCGDGWSVEITAADAATGTIKVTAPTPIAEDKVIVFASDGKGRMVAVQLRLTVDTSGNPDPPAEDPVLQPVITAYDVTKEGGEIVAGLVTNLDYEVETDAGWLVYQGTRAVRTDNLVFCVQPNDDLPRAATATITSGIYSTAIAFAQAGEARVLELSATRMNFGVEGGSKNLTVTSNIAYKYEVSDGWVTIEKANSVTTSDYVVSVGANPGLTERTATITFSGDRVQTQVLEITQAGQEPYLIVSGGPFSFDCSGGSGTIIVSTNVALTSEVSDDWITLSEGGESDGRYTVTAAPNAGFDARSATITFSGLGVESKTVEVSQGASIPYLNVSPLTFEFEPDGGTGQITVSTNVDITPVSSDEWLTLTESDGVYTVTAAANPAFDPRSATVTFSGELVGQKVVTVTQGAVMPYMTVSPDSFSFSASGGTGIINVSSNVPFSYSTSTASWLSVAPVGSSGKKFSLIVASNNTFENRSATITFTGERVEPQVITVTQTGQTARLSVMPESLNYGQDGGVRVVTVSSNDTYTLSISSTGWLTVSGSPSQGTAYFTFTAAANTSYDARSATITFSAARAGTRTVTVTQQGKAYPIPRTDGGANLYTYPGSDSHYRYGPSIIINDDGSLDVWTSKEGGNFLYYGLYAYQETGSRSKKAASGHTFAQYFNIQNKFRAIQVRMYGTGSDSDKIVIKLYKWAGSYSATLATSPIASRTFTNIASGGNYYRTYRSDQAWMAPGEYMWTATEATPSVSVSSFPGAGTTSIIDAVSYVDGTATSSYNFEMRPRGRTTTNFFSVDRFAYFHSSDGGGSWAKERDVLFGTEGSEDEWSVCDPGAAHFGGWYYLGYTSAPGKYGGTFNSCYLARSRTPAGPWYKWNGSGWGGDPAKVIEFTGATGDWGIGEPSIVVKDNTVYLYYTLTENSVTVTKVMTAPLSENWPANLTDRGVAMDKRALYSSDSADVKYVEDYGLFYAFHTYNRMTSSSKIAVWVSEDGLRFSYIGDMRGSFRPGMHNMGVSGDGEGHIRLSQQQYVSYAYVATGEWGQWSTWFAPMYFE